MDKLVDNDIIKPLVQQHARDAVFYWQQINVGCFSPLITSQKRHHFHRQLNAHLGGLRAAGQEGWDAALKNYARWKADGEAFVCLKWFTEFGHLNRGDMLTSEHYRCLNEKKKFQCRV
ncbi:hypothetical protein AHN09_004595 [Salmonella enterica subsp. enterica]|nr:hypothetical protein [Salmonella enterica subsp. enterica]